MADSTNLIVAHQNLVTGPSIVSLSASSHSIGMGAKVFVATSSARFFKDQIVRAARLAAPGSFVEGPVLSWDPVTRELEIDVTTTGTGTGPYTDWVLTGRKWWGGSWVENDSMALANLGDPLQWRVARTTDAAIASTELIVDLGQQSIVNAMVPLGLNAGIIAQARFRLIDVDPYSGAQRVAWDGALYDVWPPNIEFGTLDWGADNLWFLRAAQLRRLPRTLYTREQIAIDSVSAVTIGPGVRQFVTLGPTDAFQVGMRAAASSAANWRNSLAGDIVALGPNTIDLRVDQPEGSGSHSDWTLRALKPGGAWIEVQARLASLRFYDTGNDAGYLQGAHLIVCAARQLLNNFSFGFSVTDVDPSRQDEAHGGQLYTDVRAGYRLFDFELGFMTEDEALGFINPLKRALGIRVPALWMFRPNIAAHDAELTVFGTLQPPLEGSTVFARGRWRTRLRVREWR